MLREVPLLGQLLNNLVDVQFDLIKTKKSNAAYACRCIEVPAQITYDEYHAYAKMNPALNCYPEQSTFKISVNLVAGYKANTDQFEEDDWPDITDHYIGIVAKMPLYDTTDRSRSRDREYNRRVKTASHVARFVQVLANRNYPYREVGIYLAMEARAQARVSQDIVGVDEQIKHLEKTAGAQRNIIRTTAEATEYRLALVAMCDNEKSDHFNDYLVNVVNLPSTVRTQ